MEEDNPPSYSDAMAAIAEGMRRQGIRTDQHSFTPAELSGNFSDVIVIFPPTMRSLSSEGSSIERIDSSIPSEPPPPYTEHTPPQSPVPAAPQASFLDPPSSPFSSTSINSHRSRATAPTPDYNTQPRYTLPDKPNSHQEREDTHREERFRRNQPANLVPAGEASKDSKESDFDPSLPARVTFDQSDYVISSSSPPSTDIKWTVPENANDFTGLIYVVGIHTSSNPSLSRSPKGAYGSMSVFTEVEWLDMLDTSRPSIRIFHTPSSLMVGPAKWKLTDPLSLHNLKVRLRVRAADGNNRLPSCKKGPWSEEVTVRYIDTRQITDSQDKAFSKQRQAKSLITTKEKRQREEPSSVDSISEPTSLNTSMPGPITLRTTEYHLSADTSIQTQISWRMPSNAGKFVKIWYEVQHYKKAPLAFDSKGIVRTVRQHCGSETSSVTGGWETIAEIQSSSLRVQKLSNVLSVGQHNWDISDTARSFDIELRVRPVGMKRNEVTTGPWSETITVYLNMDQRKN